jgi:hypothetical protein
LDSSLSNALRLIILRNLQELSGRWVVEPDPGSAVGMATLLRFDITLQVSTMLFCLNAPSGLCSSTATLAIISVPSCAIAQCVADVQPKITLPSSVISYVVRAGLPANIQAVARRAEQVRMVLHTGSRPQGQLAALAGMASGEGSR